MPGGLPKETVSAPFSPPPFEPHPTIPATMTLRQNARVMNSINDRAREFVCLTLQAGAGSSARTSVISRAWHILAPTYGDPARSIPDRIAFRRSRAALGKTSRVLHLLACPHGLLWPCTDTRSASRS